MMSVAGYEIRDGVRYYTQLPAVFQHQADATLSQVNPVSATLYPVLATTANVRIITMSAKVTWAVTQPDPLELVVTIDGQTLLFIKVNPVTNTWYYASLSDPTITGGELQGTESGVYRAFMLEGRSVKVDARVTWAVTQPTPLVVRIKWARIP